MKKTAQQKAIDNRANQLNPNNPAYYSSRMGNQKTIIVNLKKNKNNRPQQKKPKRQSSNGQTRRCTVCGFVGNVRATGDYYSGGVELRCGSCNANFWVTI